MAFWPFGKTIPAIMLVSVAFAAPAVADQFEQDVLAELNYARSHPAEYAQELQRYREAFDGRLVHLESPTGDLMTREGVAAVDEAVDFLRNQPPLPPLQGSSLLATAAFDFASEQGEAGQTGHISAGGLTPGQRVQRRGGGIYVGETIAYGSLSPSDVVRQLIIDDGVADRGHRKLIFDGRLRTAGAGCSRHRVWRLVCVIDYGQTADGRPGR